MSITEKIKAALDTINIPSFFISRGEGAAPCIVYNYYEVPHIYTDNKELNSKFNVHLNLYCVNEIEKTKKLVIDAMKDNGFVKSNIQNTMVDDTGYYNTPMIFKISLRGD